MKKKTKQTLLKTYEIDRLDGTKKERFQVTRGSEPETLVKDYVSTNEYEIREIGGKETVKTWIRMLDHAYDNDGVPTGKDWTWDYWTHDEPRDVDFTLFHANGHKCAWWVKADMPQVIIDLHAHGYELGSATLADRASDVVWGWLKENANLNK